MSGCGALYYQRNYEPQQHHGELHTQDKTQHECNRGSTPKSPLLQDICKYRNSTTCMYLYSVQASVINEHVCIVLSVTADVSSSVTCVTRYKGKCSNYACNFVGIVHNCIDHTVYLHMSICVHTDVYVHLHVCVCVCVCVCV